MLKLTRDRLDARSRELGMLLQRDISALRSTLQRKRRRAEQFTVALFGRTMAGKSTIREAITGGDGSTIGEGGQRTTRQVKEYSWHGINIIDTPGFGAYDGSEDRDRAYDVVDECDLILFLLSTDGTQDEAFREMAELDRLQKYVIFVLNVRLNLRTIRIIRRQFLAAPEKWLGEESIRPHIDRIKSMDNLYPNLMAGEMRLVAVHAQAAHLANLPEYEDEARKLRDASNFRELLGTLENELFKQGPVRRVQTIIGGTERALAFTAEHLETVSKELEREAGLLEEKCDALHSSLNEFVAKFPIRCRERIKEHFEPALRGLGKFVEENQDKENFTDRWQVRIANLKITEKAQSFTQEIAQEVAAKVTEFQRQYEYDKEFNHKQEAQGAERYDAIDWQKVARRVAMIVGLAAFLATPTGWGAAAAIATTMVCTLLSSLFPKGKAWKEAVVANTKKLEEEVSRNACKLETRLLEWFSKEVETGLITPLLLDVDKMCQMTRELSKRSRQLAVDLTSARRELLSHYPDLYPNTEPPKSATP